MPAFLVRLEKHQFALDGGDSDRGMWRNHDWVELGLGTVRGRLSIFSDRATGYVPVTIDLADAEPTLDLEAWSRVTLAHWICAGTPAIQELGRLEPTPIDIPRGEYRVLVCSGDLDSSEPDGSCGAEHHRIILWPGSAVEPRAVKPAARPTGQRRTPRHDLARCFTMLASDDRHTRFCATIELARHGTDAALAALGAHGDVLDRVQTVGSLGVALPIRVDRLEAFAGDDDRRVLEALLYVLDRAIRDFDAGRSTVLDTDAAYRILRHLGSASDPRIQTHACRTLTSLDDIGHLP